MIGKLETPKNATMVRIQKRSSFFFHVPKCVILIHDEVQSAEAANEHSFKTIEKLILITFHILKRPH